VAGQEEEFRSLLVLAWYSWMQEFFCDAVGVTMGGPAYLKAFSHYLRLRSTEQYYRPRKEQLRSRHPVALLRIKMLADRARLMGLGVLADEVEGEWALCAKLMKVTEDYEGVWADEFFIPLRDRLSDMLEETGPLRWQPYVPGTIANPTQVCELAWSKFEDSPQQYRAWEIETVNEIRRNLLSGKIFGVDCTPA
jgi:hypothetical protein